MRLAFLEHGDSVASPTPIALRRTRRLDKLAQAVGPPRTVCSGDRSSSGTSHTAAMALVSLRTTRTVSVAASGAASAVTAAVSSAAASPATADAA